MEASSADVPAAADASGNPGSKSAGEGGAAAPAAADPGSGAAGEALDGPRRVKRKIALVVGYIGTKYRGLQINYELEGAADRKSVEEMLRAALVRASAITALNAERLEQKINWSRSSRTDAGVHALRLVVCAKLLVLPDDIDESGYCPALVAQVNEHLPDDVRCFGAVRVPNNFDSKTACSWREYEYLLPARLLQRDGADAGVGADELARRLQRVMQHFEGCHSFHNFTRLKAADLAKRTPAEGGRGRKRKAQDSAADEVAAPPDGGCAELAEGEVAASASSASMASAPGEGACGAEAEPPSADTAAEEGTDATTAAPSAAGGTKPAIPGWIHICVRDLDTGAWRERADQVMKHTLSTIHMCAVETARGGSLLRVRLRGQYFLYNQIRLMVGTAVAVCSGLIPEELIGMALALRNEMQLPLAPSTGLLLRTAGFSELDKRAGYCAMDGRQAHDCMLPAGGILLMSDDAVALAEQFVPQVESEIERQWHENGDEQAWYAKLGRLQVPDEATLGELREKARGIRLAEAESRVTQGAADRKRRESMLENRSGSFVGLMPRRFAADLMVSLRLLPGWRVTNIQHALACHMRSWNVSPEDRPPGMSWPPETKELLDYVAKVGADALAEEGQEAK